MSQRFMRKQRVLLGCAVLLCVAGNVLGEKAVTRWRGSDLKGGGGEVFGREKLGRASVNYVYAASQGERSSMQGSFSLPAVPAKPLVLYLEGSDDDVTGACPIEILLNGRSLFKGDSGFPDNAFAWKTYAIPTDALRAGNNEVVIRNAAAEGSLGMPPWFMVARLAIAGEGFDVQAPPPIEEDFFVTLPTEKRPVPEPAAEGQRVPGFKIRGTKGWMWTPEQYLAEIPTLVACKMNFFMNCYTSMCDIENVPWGNPRCNRWWEPLPAAKKQAYEQVVRACQKAGIDFCFSMNPNLSSSRFVNSGDPEDVEALWQHYAWMQGLGVKWFNISLDDITQGIDAVGQAKVVNEIFGRLRAKDPKVNMVFCPTFYWGRGAAPQEAAYLELLSRELDPEVYCFWTGDGVVGQITRSATEEYKGRIKHRIIIWDNYPVNDRNPTLHLGPVIKRDPDLGEVVDGYMANPLCPQNEINRIPLMTMADYAYNPYGYDAGRSIGQAILHQADTRQQQTVLRDLVELYPGMLLTNQGTGWNPVLARFSGILGEPHSRYLADVYLRHVEAVARRLAAAFPDRYAETKKTLAGNIESLKAAYASRYGSPPRTVPRGRRR